MKKIFAVLLLSVLLFPAMVFAGDYVIDSAHTSIGFRVKHMTIAHVSGWFEEFSGTFATDEKQKLAAVGVEIAVQSINTKIKKRDDHLRSADFFEVSRYPSISFKTISVESKGGSDYRVKGELRIKDTLKIVELDGEMHGPLKDPWGNERAAIVLTGSVDRKDFGLNWNKVIETGGLLVGDRVQIYLEGEGIRQ